MASLNLSTNGPSISKSYQSVVNSPPPSGPPASSSTYGQWVLFSVQAPLVSAFANDTGKESVLKVQTTGEGELVDLVEEFSDGRIQFAFVKVKDPNTTLPKNVLIAWCGQGVPERTKGYFTSHLAAVSNLLHGYHVQVTARSDADLSPETIVQKVADASGSKYSGGGSLPPKPAGGPPPLASKPVFQPTRVGGGGSGFNPLSGRTRAAGQGGQVDEDGWGADAPPVERSQIEKVESAYKPTKVNMAELQSQQQPPSRLNAPSVPSNGNSRPDVVQGAYQPVGKVDISEIRRLAKADGGMQDDRPTLVKGAYEPVGKVDIAAIRAQAQGPGGSPTGPLTRNEEAEEQPSLSERSSAFQQSERLTSMPKPKVGKFGVPNNFTGTKAPAPGGFGPKPLAAAAPVGTASKTFADEGGKTPAQLWQERKAKQGGGLPSSYTGAQPIGTQTSGSGGWKSGYAGKSWAPVQTTRTGQSASSQPDEHQQEQEASPSGGVGAMRDRFSGAVPMGAASSHDTPPPMDFSSKPNAGARGVPLPGLPIRPKESVLEEQHVNMPPPPSMPPRPDDIEDDEPDVRPSSPVRIAMPVSRGAAPLEPVEAYPKAVPTESIAAAPLPAVPPEPQVGPVTAAADLGLAEDGPIALAQYDYPKAELNEIDLREGAYVTQIDMVDEDWWMGTNEKGERGLFPSAYVEIMETDAIVVVAAHPPPDADAYEPKPPTPVPVSGADIGPTATAQYEYEAAEENELSFPDGAPITNVEFPDDDWWYGHYGGKSGLFPANHVELDQY